MERINTGSNTQGILVNGKNQGTSSAGQKASKENFFTLMKNHFKCTTEKNDSSSVFFLKWAPSLLSIAAVLATWELSIMAGMIMGICGIFYGAFSRHSANKVISAVAGGIAIGLSLFCMLL